MSDSDLHVLGATALRDEIARGAVTATQAVKALLARIDAVESDVQAWAHIDPDYALKQAAALDSAKQAGRAIGPLHGVPVGIKDIIDVKGLPCEYGTPIHSGRRPGKDATLVAKLREAGAVIMGKTVSTEYAVYTPGKTRNPVNFEHTPGGSSSGSAAAVAAGMVPLAVGTQTNASIVRPAAFCGVVGFKPTHGLISRFRVLSQSRLLDQIGVIARTVDDAALLAEVLIGYDDFDPDSQLVARPPLVKAAGEEPPALPRFAFAKTPKWEQLDPEYREALGELQEVLGDRLTVIPLEKLFDQVLDWHKAIHEADLALSFAVDFAKSGDKMSEKLQGMIKHGGKVKAINYNSAARMIPEISALFEQTFEDFDAVLTPATLGAAPKGLDNTGDPVMSTFWTFAGMPALTLPLFQNSQGLPLGVQLAGKRGNDARLLRSANWLTRFVEKDA